MQRQSKKTKLETIKAILNGTYDFRKPKYFFVLRNENTDTYEVGSLIMSKVEFEQWEKENYRPIDTMLIMPERTTVEMQCDNIKHEVIHTEIKPAPRKQIFIESTETKKPSYHLKLDVEEAEITEVIKEVIKEQVEPEMKRSGKLSEYGSSWSFSDETIKALNY